MHLLCEKYQNNHEPLKIQPLIERHKKTAGTTCGLRVFVP
jgi:hypothetical protein